MGNGENMVILGTLSIIHLSGERRSSTPQTLHSSTYWFESLISSFLEHNCFVEKKLQRSTAFIWRGWNGQKWDGDVARPPSIDFSTAFFQQNSH